MTGCLAPNFKTIADFRRGIRQAGLERGWLMDVKRVRDSHWNTGFFAALAEPMEPAGRERRRGRVQVSKALPSLAIWVAIASTNALAQGHVTAYGSLGFAARVKTHATPLGSTDWALGPSPGAAGICGVWGTEDLGRGMKTHFNLESGFDLDTGALSYSGLAWGREVAVGLTTPFGRFDLGRLQVQGLAAEPLVTADPMRASGSFAETLWPGLYTGNRFDNALRWRAKVGPVFGSLYAALGERGVPRSRAGRTLAASIGYAAGPLHAQAAVQTNRDKNDVSNRAVTVGATYTAGATTWHGAYLHAKRDQGFVMGSVGEPLAVSGLGLGANVPSLGAFSTDFVFAGLTRRWQTAWTAKVAVYHARSRGGTLIATEGGRQASAYAVLEYALSRRTVLEAGIDHNRWTGGWGGFWGSSAESGVRATGHPFRNGFDTRTSASAGLRHEF